jgi:molybdopterin synthase sulfur carrier subunit
MARVFLPAALRGLTRGQTEVELAASTVREVIVQLETHFPGIRARLCEGDELASTLQVAVGNVMTRSLAQSVGPDMEVHFIPAIGGG